MEYILIFIVPRILTEMCHSVLQLQCFLLRRILTTVHGHSTQFEEKQLQFTLCSIRLTGSFDSLQIYLQFLFSKYLSVYYATGNILSTNKGEIQMVIEAQLAQELDKTGTPESYITTWKMVRAIRGPDKILHNSFIS